MYWFHDPLDAPATQTFTLRYHVVGGLRIYPDGDQLWWQALPPDRAARIDASRVTVHLVGGTKMTDVKVDTSPQGLLTVTPGPDNTLTFTAGRTIDPDEAPEIRVQWPHGLVAAAPPAWQQADDTARAQAQQEIAQQQAAEQRAAQERAASGARWDLLSLILAALFGVGGVLFWLLRWYTGGRDKPVGVVASYLTAPPSNLPPALVDVLLQETTNIRDVTATILDLGRKGNLTIQEVVGHKSWGSDYKYHRSTTTGSCIATRAMCWGACSMGSRLPASPPYKRASMPGCRPSTIRCTRRWTT